MTITHIRFLQHLCLFLVLMVFGLIPASLLLESHWSNVLLQAWFVVLVLTGLLILSIRRLRCPICGAIFVGREDPMLFRPTCANCGRRSGDTY
jgi:carbon starvation protein CstA